MQQVKLLVAAILAACCLFDVALGKDRLTGKADSIPTPKPAVNCDQVGGSSALSMQLDNFTCGYAEISPVHTWCSAARACHSLGGRLALSPLSSDAADSLMKLDRKQNKIAFWTGLTVKAVSSITKLRRKFATLLALTKNYTAMTDEDKSAAANTSIQNKLANRKSDPVDCVLYRPDSDGIEITNCSEQHSLLCLPMIDTAAAGLSVSANFWQRVDFATLGYRQPNEYCSSTMPGKVSLVDCLAQAASNPVCASALYSESTATCRHVEFRDFQVESDLINSGLWKKYKPAAQCQKNILSAYHSGFMQAGAETP